MAASLTNRAVVLAIAGVFGLTGVARAQNGPLGDPMGTRMADTQPVDALGQPAAVMQGAQSQGAQPVRPANPAQPQQPQNGRVYSPYWNGDAGYQQSDLPAADIRAVPPARAAAVEAEWLFRRGERRIEQLFRDLNRDFESSAEFKAARADEKAAWDEFRAARTAALEATVNDPVYQSNEKLRADLTQQIAEMRDAGNPTDEQIAAMAQLKIGYGTENRKNESAVLANDANVKAARAKLQTVATRVRELRAAHDDALRGSEELRLARAELEDLRIARLVTGAYLNSTIRARNYSLQYAYTTSGYPNYYGNPRFNRYNNGSGPYGNYSGYYGGGYGYNYGGFSIGRYSGGRFVGFN